MKLWDYDRDTLLPNLPTMVTFPKLDQFYNDWASDLHSKGVDIHLNTTVTAILGRSKDGVILQTAPYNPDKQSTSQSQQSSRTTTECFGELVLAVLADDAKRLLGKNATWRERFVLGGAKFYDDITVTHSDSQYFQRMYETSFNPDLCAQPTSTAQEDQIAFASASSPNANGEPAGYRPMYYTHSYTEDPQKIEMSFDCTNYQHQFRVTEETGEVKPQLPYDYHVFQSIFLDKTNSHMWTMDQIDESKVIEKKWWHQLGHRWQHYVRVVPGMMFINGRNRTWFAGSWTLVVCCALSVLTFFPTPIPPTLPPTLPKTIVTNPPPRTCTNSPASPASPPPTVSAPSTAPSTILQRIFSKGTSSLRMGCCIGAGGRCGNSNGGRKGRARGEKRGGEATEKGGEERAKYSNSTRKEGDLYARGARGIPDRKGLGEYE